MALPTSESMPVLSGVPQGSVLGPLLFLTYIDGITSIPISSYTKIALYADDLLLFRPIFQQEDFTTLQRDIMAIEQWVLDNHLTFNTSKCSYMMLSRKRFPTTPLHPLMLNGLHLNKVECFKYLGVLLSSDLSWTLTRRTTSYLTRFRPQKLDTGSSQHVEWSSSLGKIRHKPPIVTCQTKILSHSSDISMGRELLHCQNLIRIRENPLSRENTA